MTKRKLEQIYFMKIELNKWKKRRANLHLPVNTSARKPDGMPYSKTNAISRPVEDAAVKISTDLERIDKQITKHIKKLNKAIAEVEAYIMTLDDSEIRIILECRCVELMSWKQVADTLGSGYTEEAVRQQYHRFISTLPPHK